MLVSKVDALFQKLDRPQPIPSPSGSSSGVHALVNICEMCGIEVQIMSERLLVNYLKT